MIAERISSLSGRFPRLWRWLVVLLILTLSFHLGRQPTQRFMLLIGGAAIMLVLLQKPELGLVALLTGALCVPFAIGTGTQTSLNVAVLLIPLLLVAWIAGMVLRRDVRLASSPVNAPALLFILAATLSLIAGNLPWNYFAGRASMASQMGGWFILVLSPAVLLLVGNQITDLRWLKGLAAIFLSVGALVVVGRFVGPVGALTGKLVVEGATGSVFWVWLVALAAAETLFDRSLSATMRATLGALALAALGIGWFFGRSWASGWMPPLVALGTLIVLRWRLPGLALVAAGAMALIVITPGVTTNVIAENRYSIITRDDARQILLEDVLPASPILGVGPSNYYFYTPIYAIRGYYLSFNSHNQYVDIVVQTGILGLSVLAWLMLAIGRLGWGLRGRVGNGFAGGYVNACLAGLLGTLASGWLGDWFLPFVYNIGLTGFRSSVLAWMFLGGLVVLENLSRTARESET